MVNLRTVPKVHIYYTTFLLIINRGFINFLLMIMLETDFPYTIKNEPKLLTFQFSNLGSFQTFLTILQLLVVLLQDQSILRCSLLVILVC